MDPSVSVARLLGPVLLVAAIPMVHNPGGLQEIAGELFGWAMIVSGAARVALPAAVSSLGGAMMDRPAATRVSGVVWASIGAYLSYPGYARNRLRACGGRLAVRVSRRA